MCLEKIYLPTYRIRKTHPKLDFSSTLNNRATLSSTIITILNPGKYQSNARLEIENGKYDLRCCLLTLFYSLNYVVPKLSFNRSRNMTLFKLKRSFFEFFNHLAPRKGSEVAAFFAGGAKRNLLCYSPEFFAFVEASFGGLRFC